MRLTPTLCEKSGSPHFEVGEGGGDKSLKYQVCPTLTDFIQCTHGYGVWESDCTS